MTREEALHELTERYECTKYVDSKYVDAVSIEAIEIAIKALNRPHGEWIRNDAYGYKCSICGRTVRTDVLENPYKSYPYCHCGARMKEVW